MKKPMKAAEAVRIAKAAKKVPHIAAQMRKVSTMDRIHAANNLVLEIGTQIECLSAIDAMDRETIEALIKLGDTMIMAATAAKSIAYHHDRKLRKEIGSQIVYGPSSADIRRERKRARSEPTAVQRQRDAR
jgi:mRNA degradation ribonuclease J1/J2